MTYDEIADHFGITRGSAENKVRAARWAKAKNTNSPDRKARFHVPVEELENAKTEPETPPEGPTPKEIIATLTAKLTAAEELRKVETTALRDTLKRADDLAEMHRQTANEERQKRLSAETERDALKARLALPWWKRLK